MIAPLHDAVSSLAVVLTFRALPFLCFAIVQPRRRVLAAVAAWVIILAAAGYPASQEALVLCVPAYAYYALIAGLVHWMAQPSVRIRGARAVVLLATLIALLLVIPARIAPAALAASCLFIGWELVFKSYSYVVECGAAKSDLRSALFFLLVDPTVVFPHRAISEERSAAPQSQRHIKRASLARLLLGVGLLLAVFFFGDPIRSQAEAVVPAFGFAGLAFTFKRGALRTIVGYAKHSSVASIQIAAMRLCAFRIGERYRYPLLAHSPAEFWRRWNVYLGNWAQRYVFTPLALTGSRVMRRLPRNMVRAGATALTFATMGAFHDLVPAALDGTFTSQSMLFFMFQALLLLTWEGLRFVRVERQPRKSTGRASHLLKPLLVCTALFMTVGMWP